MSTHYGLNNYFCYLTSRRRLSGTLYSNKVFLVGDVNDKGGGMMRRPGMWAIKPLVARHSDNTICNMAFADGHVEALKAEDYANSYWTGDW